MFEGFNIWDKIMEALGLKKRTEKKKEKPAKKPEVSKKKIEAKASALMFEVEKVRKEKKERKKKQEVEKKEKKRVKKKEKPAEKVKKKASRAKEKPLMFEVEKRKKEKLKETVKEKEKKSETVKGKEKKKKKVIEKTLVEKPKAERKIEKAGEKKQAERVEKFKTWPGITIQGPASLKVAVEKARSQQSIEEKIEETKNLMKNLEREFFKRHITQEEFRKKMLEYRQRIYLLRLKKKGEQGEKVKPEIAKKGFERISKAPLQGLEEPVKMQPITIPMPEGRAAIQRTGTLQQPLLPKGIELAIKEKAGGIENEQKLQEVEKKLQGVIEKYNIPTSEIEKEIHGINKGSVIEGIDKVIHLIELEQKTHLLMQEQLARQMEEKTVRIIKPEFGTGFEGGVPKKKQLEVKKILKEVEKHKIVTQFDKLLELVKKKGMVKLNEAMKELSLDRDKAMEYCEILADSGLVELEFPPFGQIIVKVPGFVIVKKTKEKKTGKEEKGIRV